MPDLLKSLQGKDLGHLRIVAEHWGEVLDAPDLRVGLPRLTALLLDRGRAAEMVTALPAEARQALDDLLNHAGRLPWALFTRRYGALREMGAGRRDRQRPDRSPVSPAEMLYYHALVARAFFDGEGGPEEFAYIPDDLAALLPPAQAGSTSPLGRPASPIERQMPLVMRQHILDQSCSLLAALRLGFTPEALENLAASWEPGAPTLGALRGLLSAAGLLDASGMPLPEPLRAFLAASRAEALLSLLRAWIASPIFNELHLLPGLKPEGAWQHDPLRARQAVLDFLSTIPAHADEERPWWSLTAFIDAVRQRYPDFQRPAGDYDSWFIRRLEDGIFLRGFEHWGAVDGALLRYIITGPLFWLGVLELAAPETASAPTAFRFTAGAAALLHGQPPAGLPDETGGVFVRSDFHFQVAPLAPRSLRYQLARFCEWEGESELDGYAYRLTPASLLRARQQGLTVNQLLALLRRAASAIPPNLTRALERWERLGTEARLERLTVLRLSSPELLQQLRQSKAARFLGDPLGPTAVIVRDGALDKVLAILAEMGYLAES